MTNILKEVYSYKNTSSQRGKPIKYELNSADIVAVKKWHNFYGNPSYVFHMSNGDTHLLVDDYGAMNGLPNHHYTCVKRKKDMFNRWS